MTWRPPQRTAAKIVTLWRFVMHQRRFARPGTLEADRLDAAAALLREEYHALADDAVRNQEPSLPAFPATHESDDEPPRDPGGPYRDGR